MFTLEVVLNDLDLTGIEAMDWRRAHGLPDGTRLYTQNYRRRGDSDQIVHVDEEFARTYFPKDRNLQWVWVSASQLKPEHLMFNEFDANHLIPNLPDDVVKRIYIKHRMQILAWQSLPWWKTLWYILTRKTP